MCVPGPARRDESGVWRDRTLGSIAVRDSRLSYNLGGGWRLLKGLRFSIQQLAFVFFGFFSLYFFEFRASVSFWFFGVPSGPPGRAVQGFRRAVAGARVRFFSCAFLIFSAVGARASRCAVRLKVVYGGAGCGCRTVGENIINAAAPRSAQT